MLQKIILLAFVLSSTNCATFNNYFEKKTPPTPKITNKTPLKEAINIALVHGASYLQEVKKMIKKNKLQQKNAARILYSSIIHNYPKWHPNQLINAVGLLQYGLPSTDHTTKLFEQMITSEQKKVAEIAWVIAANFPSSPMVQKIDNYLTEAIAENEISKLYTPEMANAIANNNLVNSYSLIRQGLLHTHHASFARAMIVLNSKQASNDFMNYLALAPVEELRQLNLVTVNVFVCFEILTHLLTHEISITHPHFNHLFFFAISRNNALSELARKIIERNTPSNAPYLALILFQFYMFMERPIFCLL